MYFSFDSQVAAIPLGLVCVDEDLSDEDSTITMDIDKDQLEKRGSSAADGEDICEILGPFE
jgi:hypothetical protein